MSTLSTAVVLTSDVDAGENLARVLTGIGLRALRYADVNAAISGLNGTIPSLFVLDSVADAECRQMCRQLFAHDGFNGVSLIMLVHDSSREALNENYDAGATNVFVKPCAPEFLRERLRRYAEGEGPASEQQATTDRTQLSPEALPDITFEIDAQGRVQQCLAGADRDTLLKSAATGDQKLGDLLSPEGGLLLQAKIRAALKTRKDTELNLRVRADNRTENYNVRLIVRGRNRLLAIFKELHEQGGRALPQAHRLRDTLTRLTTRELFLAEVDDNLADAKLREGQLAVICIDLDRFTKINDTLGRGVGDIVLRESAERLRQCLAKLQLPAEHAAPAEVPIARMAGDEFVCMLNNMESRQAVEAVADSIRSAFDAPINVSGVNLHITPSIGISIFPSDGNDAETLCSNARTALDEARFQGVDSRAFFTNTLKFRSLKRPDLIKELGWAIEQEQLELHYLPRIDLATGDVSGLEALLRWIHPLRGSVPLSDVIPLAEVSGLMRPLGEWVLNTACAAASDWQASRDDAPGISINLSADEFSRNDLAQLVEKALVANNLCGEKLQFEVTEALLVRYRHSQQQIKQLQGLGARLVIDDFGTGHSSLSLLSQLPIDAIKIDRSFVDGAHLGSDQAAVCAAIIAMAHELGISVIAEGVETDQQLEFLQSKGCDAAQGFLYSRPLPAEDVGAFLDAYDNRPSTSTISNLQQALSQVS